MEDSKKKAWNWNSKKHELLKMSEVSLWLDTYDDIFSDFDPRPYSERILSDDFLYEAKKACREKKSGKIELNFLIPKDKRNPEDEKVIEERLHHHFTKHHKSLEKEVSFVRMKGAAYILAGVLMLLGASYISILKSEDIMMNMAFVVFEPAGWFITWFGLDQLFYTANRKKDDLRFYRKMSKAEIIFTSY